MGFLTGKRLSSPFSKGGLGGFHHSNTPKQSKFVGAAFQPRSVILQSAIYNLKSLKGPARFPAWSNRRLPLLGLAKH